jgi:hypothetical protein
MSATASDTPRSAAPDIVTLGETMILFLAETIGPLREATDFRRYVAGAETNVATGLCRLGHTAAGSAASATTSSGAPSPSACAARGWTSRAPRSIPRRRPA